MFHNIVIFFLPRRVLIIILTLKLSFIDSLEIDQNQTEFNEQFNNIPHESILGKTQNITNPVVDRKSVTWGVSGHFKMNKALPCGVECTLGAVKILPIL